MNIAAYPKYNEYSNREWIGNSSLPTHWSVKALKHGARIVLGKMLCPENKGGYLLRPYLKSKNIQWLSVDTSSVDEMWFSPQEINQYRLVDGDLILSEGGEVGKTCIWNSELPECYIQNSAHKVTMYRESESRYFLYQMYALGKYGSFEAAVNRVSIAHLTYEKLSNIDFAFPPLPEQRAIATFLDGKCATIDEAVRIKEEQIKLLRERKQILIQQAVTCGLNPDAPMKDSGIDWIGEIPTHWEVKRLKHVASIRYGLGQPPKEVDNGLPLLRATNVERGRINSKNMLYVDEKAVPKGRNAFLKPGEIIVVRSGAYTGDSAIVTKEYQGAVAGYDMVVSANSIGSDYLAFSLLSPFVLHEQIFLLRMRAAQPHLNREELGETLILQPTSDEQSEIVAYAKAIKRKIDNINLIKKHQIATLKEYKTSLINAAVTGKIKVI